MKKALKVKTYNLRAECLADALRLVQSIAPTIHEFGIARGDADSPDVEVTLTVSSTTISLAKLRRACNRVVDGHVMAQTVRPAENYTGERDYAL